MPRSVEPELITDAEEILNELIYLLRRSSTPKRDYNGKEVRVIELDMKIENDTTIIQWRWEYGDYKLICKDFGEGSVTFFTKCILLFYPAE